MHAVTPNPKDIATLINNNLEIPTIPVVASKALRAMQDPDISGASIAQIISQDQGLTARILKVANSALYSLTREVRNLQQAAMVLGFTTLKNLVISVSCRLIYKRFGPMERDLWHHSVGTAVAAHLLAMEKDIPDKDEAYVAGLMHDVGKVIMNNGARERFSEAAFLCRDGDMHSCDAEHRVFGFSHVDVGSILVERWELPRALGHAVFLHHDVGLAESLAEGTEGLVWVTALGDEICHRLNTPEKEYDPLVEHEAAQSLGFSERELDQLVRRISNRYSAEREILGP